MGAGIIFIIDKQLGVIRMKGILSYFISNDTGIIDSVNKAASSITEATTEGQLDQIFNSTKKASEWSYSIMNIIYILVAMVVVVAVFTITLYVYKFFMNRKDPNYKKNDDTFLDD